MILGLNGSCNRPKPLVMSISVGRSTNLSFSSSVDRSKFSLIHWHFQHALARCFVRASMVPREWSLLYCLYIGYRRFKFPFGMNFKNLGDVFYLSSVAIFWSKLNKPKQLSSASAKLDVRWWLTNVIMLTWITKVNGKKKSISSSELSSPSARLILDLSCSLTTHIEGNAEPVFSLVIFSWEHIHPFWGLLVMVDYNNKDILVKKAHKENMKKLYKMMAR